MNTDDELKLKYANRAVVRSGCWLLDVKTALAFLEDLQNQRRPLYGIEGYWLRGQGLEPSMENSVYFLGEDIRVASLAGADPVAKARSFLLSRSELDLVFDFDFGSPLTPKEPLNS